MTDEELQRYMLRYIRQSEDAVFLGTTRGGDILGETLTLAALAEAAALRERLQPPLAIRVASNVLKWLQEVAPPRVVRNAEAGGCRIAGLPLAESPFLPDDFASIEYHDRYALINLRTGKGFYVPKV